MVRLNLAVEVGREYRKCAISSRLLIKCLLSVVGI